jgi:hypothetical protein
MSIYDKSTADLSPTDLQQLLDEGAVENIRLEFKLEAPAKDETLKKLSSFANTYGGYLIVGAQAESSDGRLRALPGVDPVAGFKQKIVQWCADGTSPAIQVFVSDTIPAPGVSSKVCYVIYVPESEEAPHFLNGRKGAYVRTDEFSQRVEARLMTFEELQHLTNRRATTVKRKEVLINRAQGRFATFVDTEYSSRPNHVGGIGATLTLALVPRFPAEPLIEHGRLLQVVRSTCLQWRQVGFPRSGSVISQHESVIALDIGSNFSSVEANVWGLLYYVSEIERVYEKVTGIHLSSLLGHILVFLEHARQLYSILGYDGTIEVRLILERIRGKPFLYFPMNIPEIGPSSRLDDSFGFDLLISSSRLKSQRDDVATDILRTLFFAMNWPDVATSSDSIKQCLQYGYEFNFWQAPRVSP